MGGAPARPTLPPPLPLQEGHLSNNARFASRTPASASSTSLRHCHRHRRRAIVVILLDLSGRHGLCCCVRKCTYTRTGSPSGAAWTARTWDMGRDGAGVYAHGQQAFAHLPRCNGFSGASLSCKTRPRGQPPRPRPCLPFSHLHLRHSRPLHLSCLLHPSSCDPLLLANHIAVVGFPIHAVPLPDVPRILRTTLPTCNIKATAATTPSSSPSAVNHRTSNSFPPATHMASPRPSPSRILCTPPACRLALQPTVVPARSIAKHRARPLREGISILSPH